MEQQETKSSIKNTLCASVNKRRNLWLGVCSAEAKSDKLDGASSFSKSTGPQWPRSGAQAFLSFKMKYCSKRQLSPAGIESVVWSGAPSQTGRAQRLACLHTSLKGIGILPMGNTTVFINLPSLSSL